MNPDIFQLDSKKYHIAGLVSIIKGIEGHREKGFSHYHRALILSHNVNTIGSAGLVTPTGYTRRLCEVDWVPGGWSDPINVLCPPFLSLGKTPGINM